MRCEDEVNNGLRKPGYVKQHDCQPARPPNVSTEGGGNTVSRINSVESEVENVETFS